jgi:prevent-host-death family protein
MDVSITDLRANLASYLARVMAGETLTVTEHGRPVARLGPPADDEEARLRELEARGIIRRPTSDEPLDIDALPTVALRGGPSIEQVIAEMR